MYASKTHTSLYITEKSHPFTQFSFTQTLQWLFFKNCISLYFKRAIKRKKANIQKKRKKANLLAWEKVLSFH